MQCDCHCFFIKGYLTLLDFFYRIVSCHITTGTIVLQVNESLLRSIVTQPPRENYVYARGFDTLDLVRNLVLGKACNVLVTAGTTTTTATLPTTTVDRGGLKTIPSFDGAISFECISLTRPVTACEALHSAMLV